jgi:2-octaprenyl-6-methoxyphenol hydroxylase
VQPDCDCVVVGAGLVGSFAALALAAQGLRVSVIEQRAPIDANAVNDPRGLVLSAVSRRLFERYHLWAPLEAASNPITTVRISERGSFGSAELCAAEIGLDALGWACPADHLLRTLTFAMLDHAGISVHWQTRFVSAQAEADQILITSESHATKTNTSAKLLVAADGLDSAVRAHCGIAVDQFDYGQRALVANLSVSRPQSATAFEHFTRRGPLALIPLGGARYVSVQCLDTACANAAQHDEPDVYAAMLTRRFGTRLGTFTDLGPRYSYALTRQRAQTLYAPRTVVIGNAANAVHPNAAQGLNLGLRDVAALIDCCTGQTDPGKAAVLSAYSAARRADHVRVSTFTDVLAQAFRSPLAAVTGLRRMALTAAGYVAPLRRRVMLEASGLATLAHDAPRR